MFPEEKLTIDFSKTKNSPFDIKAESSFNAYISDNALVMGVKKTNCISWIDIPDHEFQDLVIEAKIRLDSLGGYASAGLLFRIMDKSSYYMALVSSKGYFRLDVIKDNAPHALIGWTEVSGFDGTNINLNIVTYGTYSIFIVNGRWVGDISDDKIESGRLGFVLASYDTEESDTDKKEFTCIAELDYFSVDTRIKPIEESYKYWIDESHINAEKRLLLAETFAAMGEAGKSLEQINKAWKRREEAVYSVSATYTEIRTRKELLLAARMSFRLSQYKEANEYLDAILEQTNLRPDAAGSALSNPEAGEAIEEKIKVLNEINKFKELKEFVLKYNQFIQKDVNFYTMIARCYFELKEYENSGTEWKKAFESEANGIYLVNAANAFELAQVKEEALKCYMEAGKIFLNDDNKGELLAILPKLSALGEKSWTARILAGKCAYSLEDYLRSEIEFIAANRLRCALRPRPKGDPAHFYLWGLLLDMKGKDVEAIRRVNRAVRLAPDYGLFRFKLAELKIKSGVKDIKMAEELKLALDHMDDPDGTMANHAGTILQDAGYKKSCKYFFARARRKAGA